MNLKVWQIPKVWEKGEAWIIGGGPSINDYFNIPNDLIMDIRLRKKSISELSPYFAALHSKRVIGINAAYKLGSWVDICFFGDIEFYSANEYGLSVFENLIVTCCRKVGQKQLYWIKYLPQEEKKGVDYAIRKFGISTTSNKICWNNSSGAASISLAAWLGVKRIILVGFDMTIDSKTEQQHFHNEYRQYNNPLNKASLPFTKHLLPWEIIKSDADNMGIEILNTSLNSAIKEIPKVHIKELL